MTQHREKLSAIVDGENFTDELIDEMKKDASLVGSWSRYNLVRDVLNNEVGEHVHVDFASDFAARLEQEPAILAPKVEHKWRDRLGKFKHGVVTLTQQSGQLAIAATVTFAVIFGVQQYNISSSQNSPEALISAPVIPLAINAGVSPVSLETSRPVSQRELIRQSQKVNAYILDHEQQLRLQAVQKAPHKKHEKTDEENKAQK